MYDLWQSLRDRLSFEVEIKVDESSEGQLPVIVTATVKNTASPDASGQPEIIFEDVIAKVGVPPDWKRQKLGTLNPGDAKTFEYRFGYSDMPDIQYDLEGSVSPTAFFRIRRGTSRVNDNRRLSGQVYLQLFDGMQIHRWLNSSLKSFSVSEETRKTLAQILTEIPKEIQEIQRRLGTFVSYVKGQDVQELSRHRDVVVSYFQEIVQEVGRLRQSIQSEDVRRVSAALESAILRLEEKAKQVDDATNRLRRRYIPPDEKERPKFY